MVYVYVLLCENNKYYIGKTSNPTLRLGQHFTCIGSAWTKKYKPIKIVEVIEGDDYDEDKYTLKYMNQYGINNVRGGSFSQIELDNKSVVEKMIDSVNDKCFNCGNIGHFASNCNVVDINNAEHTHKLECNRCGRYTHTDKHCYAKHDIDGYKIYNYIEHTHKLECNRCGRYTHTDKHCYAKHDIDGYKIY